MIKKATAHLDSVTVDSFEGLLVDYVQKKKVSIVLRGLRAISDFEYELQIASINKHLNPKIETCFMMTSNRYSFLSSSMVKEAAMYHGSVHELVPDPVERALKAKFDRGRSSI
jgi:pantetheine-phosphate adenylyltransferase